MRLFDRNTGELLEEAYREGFQTTISFKTESKKYTVTIEDAVHFKRLYVTLCDADGNIILRKRVESVQSAKWCAQNYIEWTINGDI